MAETSSINSVETAIEILSFLISAEGATLTEISDHFQKPTSTVHDYLNTLQATGLVVNEGVYRPSMRLLAMGDRSRNMLEFHTTAKSEADQLASELDKHVNLMIEEFGFGVYTYFSQSPETTFVKVSSIRLGVRTELPTTSSGKAILAHQSEDRVRDVVAEHGIPEMTENTLTDVEALLADLAATRDRGYAIDSEERIEGIYGIAAPVLSATNEVVGAIGVSYPSAGTETDPVDERDVRKLLEASSTIQVNLNYP